MADEYPDREQPSTVVIKKSTAVQVGENNAQYNTVYVYSHDPATWTSRAHQQPVPGSPYRGLQAFEERDEEIFFGREAAVTDVMGMLSAVERDSAAGQCPGILVISGVSGAGKSSLLHAGMLPRLRRTGTADAPEARAWPCLLFTPGKSPLAELAAQVAAIAGLDAEGTRQRLAVNPEGFALLARQAVLAQRARDRRPAGRPERLLVVIDQFEQIFTHCPVEAERRAFIAALHSAAVSGPAGPSALVVVGIRADFEPRCWEYEGLSAACTSSRYPLTAMKDRELELAITEPAKRAGAHVERELTDRLREEIRAREPDTAGAGPGPGLAGSTNAGVLPLLSYALAETWRVHRGDALTLADYDQTGGIETAVATAAERAYGTLGPRQQQVARLIFLQLTATSGDGADTAVPATRTELNAGKDPDDVQAVLGAFAEQRLLTLSEDGVQISHEILLLAWPLLRGTWLAETQADRALLGTLRNAAADWAVARPDRSYLWSGARLASAQATAVRLAASPKRLPPLTDHEASFIDASSRAALRGKRARRGLGVLSALVLVGAAVGVTAVLAERERRPAVGRRPAHARASGHVSVRRDRGDPQRGAVGAVRPGCPLPERVPVRPVMSCRQLSAWRPRAPC